MSSSTTDIKFPLAKAVATTETTISVDLSDGRTISIPINWYPRLLHATEEERKNWKLLGKGEGIHWPQLDEDISVESLILGKASGESQRSLQKWLEKRRS
ncbi:MAG TPA: DUF2442 domain-containing protein [Phaeodactylibacter sp.]|nr:DUF2442 domain-containing protein [Phaeodactylibacter sp.]